MVVCVAVLSVGPIAAAAAAAAVEETLAPARAGLAPVPFPSLDQLEPVVAAQINDARAGLARVASKASASRGDLGAAYGELARLFHAYELFASAEPAYLNAARLQPGEPAWPHLLGYLYQQTGQFARAAERFAGVLRLRPEQRAAALRLADVSLELNRLADAREQYTSLLPVFPAAARRGLGEVSLRERRFREAVEHFTIALERAPQASALRYSLAMAYRGLGRLEEARAQLEQRGPGTIVAADAVVDALAPLVRGERLLVIQGSRAYAAGRFADAAAAFERALAVAPASVPARANLASALLQLGEASRGVEQLRAALAQAPVDASVSRQLEATAMGLAILLSERERFADAIAILDDTRRRLPGRAAVATTLARLLSSSPDIAQRDGARALALATEVYASEPRALHAETMALALAELGRCAEALEWMRRSVSAAEAENDPTQLARLRGETPKYQTASCRAPGK
jgi:tetratricopeptide (TPR) repeat protein